MEAGGGPSQVIRTPLRSVSHTDTLSTKSRHGVDFTLLAHVTPHGTSRWRAARSASKACQTWPHSSTRTLVPVPIPPAWPRPFAAAAIRVAHVILDLGPVTDAALG